MLAHTFLTVLSAFGFRLDELSVSPCLAFEICRWRVHEDDEPEFGAREGFGCMEVAVPLFLGNNAACSSSLWAFWRSRSSSCRIFSCKMVSRLSCWCISCRRFRTTDLIFCAESFVVVEII